MDCACVLFRHNSALLKGKPAAVGYPAKRGVVVAASYEAVRRNCLRRKAARKRHRCRSADRGPGPCGYGDPGPRPRQPARDSRLAGRQWLGDDLNGGDVIKLIWHDADGACLFRIGSSGDECTQFVPIVWSLTGHSGSERDSFSGAVLYKYRKLLVPQERFRTPDPIITNLAF